MIHWRPGDETEGLCCGKTEAVMSGLDGNVRSPRAARKKRNPSIFLFYQSFMNKSGLCYLLTRFAILSFMLPPLSPTLSVFVFPSFTSAASHEVKTKKRSTETPQQCNNRTNLSVTSSLHRPRGLLHTTVEQNV